MGPCNVVDSSTTGTGALRYFSMSISENFHGWCLLPLPVERFDMQPRKALKRQPDQASEDA